MYDANNEHSADDKLTARELSPQSVPINLEANKITKNVKRKRRAGRRKPKPEYWRFRTR